MNKIKINNIMDFYQIVEEVIFDITYKTSVKTEYKTILKVNQT
jgi:hypothetical protein